MTRRLQLALGAVLAASISALAGTAQPNTSRFVFLVMVHNSVEERDAALLIDSIRAFAGDAADAPVYAVLTDSARTPGTLLKARGARTMDLDMDPRFRAYPFADKVWASEQVERLAEKEADVLVWVNPESLVIAPLREFDLSPEQDAAFRPVHVQNVGLALGAAPDAFWTGVWKTVGLSADRAFAVESFLEDKKIHAYFNSGFFAVRLRRGIMRAWRENFEKLLLDDDFQRVACPDDSHKIFLHQAVLSATVARLGRERIRLLPPTYSYPLNFQKQLPPERRAKNMNSLVHVLTVGSFRDIRWMDELPVEEPLRSWLLKHIQGETAATNAVAAPPASPARSVTDPASADGRTATTR